MLTSGTVPENTPVAQGDSVRDSVAISADIEPEIAGQGEQAHQEVAFQLDPHAHGIRADEAEPVRVLAVVRKSPDFVGQRFEACEELPQLLVKFNAIFGVLAGRQGPDRTVARLGEPHTDWLPGFA
jgi:hypothetical protein